VIIQDQRLKHVTGHVESGNMKATDLNLSEMPAMTLHGPDGFGLTQYSGDEYALVGGFRDGSSNAGELRLKYQIYSHALIDANNGDFAKGEIGYCVVRVASDDGPDQGDILGLIDIELKPKYRKSGHGKKIVRDIVDTTKSGNLDIHDIQKKAKKFWDKMGVEYKSKQTGSAQNAVLKKQTESLDDFNKDEPNKSTVAIPGYGTMNIDSLMKNVINQTTQMVKQMQSGAQGFRNADYALNSNKVLPAKVAALVKALDDLQAIRAKGGANSRNIQQEAEEQQQLPVDVNKIMGNIQEFESKKYITPEDADLMRRGVQSLSTPRQTVNPDAILKLLTMVTR
jgi:flagellin-like hook-associated protein FlgL